MMNQLRNQPDDPGPHDGAVHFESSGFGRELIKLGSITIGEIMPCGGKLRRVQVLFRLPDVPRTMFGCTSMQAAHDQAKQLVSEWLDAAGLRS